MLAHSGSSSVLYCLSSEMSTKNSHFLLSKLGNRSSLNPSCFKEKQRPESDFPGAKVAGIPKVQFGHLPKSRKPPLSPCRTTRILRERGAFPSISGLEFLSAAVSPTRRSQGKPPEKTGAFLQGLCFPSGDTFRPLLGCLMGCVCPHKNIVEKGKCAGAGASPAPLCKGSWQKSLIFD